MSLSADLVDIQDIYSQVNRSEFPEYKLEQLAQSILQSGGLIKPLVLKRTGVSSFDIIAGNFEYYAVLKAQEIDDNLEMIRAFIIEPNQEEFIKNQLEALNSNPTSVTVRDSAEPQISNFYGIESRILNMESRQNNLESRLNEGFERQNLALEKMNQKLDQEIKDIKSQIPKQLEALEAFNCLSLSELAFRLKTANITGKTADKILQKIESERYKKPFESLGNIVQRIEGLGDKRMISILDTWSKIIF